MDVNMNLDTKMKILKRINTGQSQKMILWEFKITKRELESIVKEFKIPIRTTDAINFSTKMSKKN